ncbi:MAG: hypothetical protein L7F78_06900 [Syntrophales bacterium LBB04]|nr:hypothetical protein [Syntrophales bacterium LBB04]
MRDEGHIWIRTIRTIAIFAGVFGVLTIKEGGSVLFGGAEAGAYVPFVLWFNFLAGFVYIITAVGLWLHKSWAALLSVLLASTTAMVFAAFVIHVTSGGAYEMRTVWAMTLRTSVWTVIAILACAILGCGSAWYEE